MEKEQVRSGVGSMDVTVTLFSLLLIAAIAFPAALAARESARQVQSVDHLRFIGEGMLRHADTFGFLPGNGGPSASTVSTPDARTLNPNDADETYQWGYGDPRLAGRNQPGSWAFAILPFIGQQQAFAKRDQAVAVPQYYIPGRRKPVAEVAIEESDPLYPGRFRSAQ